jgi:hypothetical protein
MFVLMKEERVAVPESKAGDEVKTSDSVWAGQSDPERLVELCRLCCQKMLYRTLDEDEVLIHRLIQSVGDPNFFLHELCELYAAQHDRREWINKKAWFAINRLMQRGADSAFVHEGIRADETDLYGKSDPRIPDDDYDYAHDRNVRRNRGRRVHTLLLFFRFALQRKEQINACQAIDQVGANNNRARCRELDDEIFRLCQELAEWPEAAQDFHSSLADENCQRLLTQLPMTIKNRLQTDHPEFFSHLAQEQTLFFRIKDALHQVILFKSEHVSSQDEALAQQRQTGVLLRQVELDCVTLSNCPEGDGFLNRILADDRIASLRPNLARDSILKSLLDDQDEKSSDVATASAQAFTSRQRVVASLVSRPLEMPTPVPPTLAKAGDRAVLVKG